MQDKLYRKVQLNKAYEDDYPATNKATRQRLDKYYKKDIDNGLDDLNKSIWYDDMDWYMWHMFNDLELTDDMFEAWWECQDNSILNNIKVVK